MSPPSRQRAQDTQVEPAEGRRLHALDALRATALLLGIAFHATLAYVPGIGVGWVIEDRSTHVLFTWASLVVHSFRIPVFFFLAGFFARSLRERYGTWDFARDRVARILVPLVLGWLMVYPLLAFTWIWGADAGDPRAALSDLRAAFGAKQLVRLAHASAGEFPLTHLWFLLVLLQLYAVLIPVRVAWTRALDRGGAWRARADGALRRAAGSPWLVPLLAVASVPVLFSMKGWAIDTPDASLVPPLATLLLYGFLFSLGWLFHRQPALLEVLAKRLRPHAGIAVITACAVVALYGGSAHGPRSPAPVRFRVGYMLLYGAMMWSWVFTAVGFAVRHCSARSRAWRYLADSSYWVYIVHLPLVCGLQVAVSRVEAPAWSKFAFVVSTTAFLCLATYHLLVRSTAIGVLLNGRRHAPGAPPARGVLRAG